MRIAAFVACLVPMLSATAAHAELEESFALAYQAPEGAGCPTEEALRASVADELGYDPWDPVDDGSSPRIVVAIHAVRDGVRGRVEMRAVDGKRLGARELEAARCGELSRALALAIAVAIDPLRAATTVPTPSRATSNSRATTAAATPATTTKKTTTTDPTTAPTDPDAADAPPLLAAAAPPPRGPRFVDEARLRVAFGVQGTVDAAPGPTFGFMGRVGFAIRRWSAAVELRGDLPGSADVDGGRVSASTMAAFLVPCVHHRVVAFCALGGAGGQEVAGSGYVLARSSWVPYAALGARIELELAVNRVMALLVHVDVLAPLTRAELYVGTERPQRVYRSEPVSSSFGLLLSTR